ncbi:hypothetical protein J6590_022646 [Homalodisca vitripennis]|nr:hypothetical protein J6590_022646 [Homalodisca vitripennis]
MAGEGRLCVNECAYSRLPRPSLEILRRALQSAYIDCFIHRGKEDSISSTVRTREYYVLHYRSTVVHYNPHISTASPIGGRKTLSQRVYVLEYHIFH